MLLVERRLEGIHAIIGGAGKQTLTNVNLPPSISAHCRKPQILEAFNEDLFLVAVKERMVRSAVVDDFVETLYDTRWHKQLAAVQSLSEALHVRCTFRLQR